MSPDSRTSQPDDRDSSRRAGHGAVPLPQYPPFKPHRLLMALMGLVLLCLMAGLIWMYVVTIRPYRERPHTIEIDTVPNAPPTVSR